MKRSAVLLAGCLATLVCLAAPAQAAIPAPIPSGCLRLTGLYYSGSSMGVTISVTAWSNNQSNRVHVGNVGLRRDRFGLHITWADVDPEMAALGYTASVLDGDAPVGDWVHVWYSNGSATDYHFVVKRLSATGGGMMATAATC